MNGTEFPFPGKEPPVPPLGLVDAEHIVRRLGPALRAHAAWIQDVHTTLVCRTTPDEGVGGDESHLHSVLGRWFVDESSEFVRRRPDYMVAVRLHRDAHVHVRELFRAVAEGRPITPPEYLAFAEVVGRLDRSLEALVREFWELLRFTDPLTGIATRYAMLPRLREEHGRVQRTGQCCSVCVIDLDHFKRINDTWGHDAGDIVLGAVSAHLAQHIRGYDQVCRYGGEEFVLMLPNTSPEQAVPIVDRLRRGLAGLGIPFDDDVLAITASFGISSLAGVEPIGASIKRADEAMYAAKRAGRNRVAIWTPAGPVVDDASQAMVVSTATI